MNTTDRCQAETQPWSDADVRDLRQSRFSALLTRGYALRSRVARSAIMNLANRFEGGQFYSFTLREVLKRYYGVHVGAYSYGACLIPGGMPRGVTIGRFSSIALGLKVFLRNHPYDFLSTHPFFYNKECGILAHDSIGTGSLEIGHDTWVGANVVVTPGCQQIGLGAIVGAGSVVTKNVPDFAIVAGNPAKLIRQRFPEALCESIRQSQWWNESVSTCSTVIGDMTRPLQEIGIAHPLLKQKASLFQKDLQLNSF